MRKELAKDTQTRQCKASTLKVIVIGFTMEPPPLPQNCLAIANSTIPVDEFIILFMRIFEP